MNISYAVGFVHMLATMTAGRGHTRYNSNIYYFSQDGFHFKRHE